MSNKKAKKEKVIKEDEAKFKTIKLVNKFDYVGWDTDHSIHVKSGSSVKVSIEKCEQLKNDYPNDWEF